MRRFSLLLAGLFVLLVTAQAFAAPMGATRLPNGKIMPGSHRPVYKRYGHHGISKGMFSNMFRGFASTKQTKSKKSVAPRVAKAHRGTL